MYKKYTDDDDIFPYDSLIEFSRIDKDQLLGYSSRLRAWCDENVGVYDEDWTCHWVPPPLERGLRFMFARKNDAVLFELIHA